MFIIHSLKFTPGLIMSCKMGTIGSYLFVVSTKSRVNKIDKHQTALYSDKGTQ